MNPCKKGPERKAHWMWAGKSWRSRRGSKSSGMDVKDGVSPTRDSNVWDTVTGWLWSRVKRDPTDRDQMLNESSGKTPASTVLGTPQKNQTLRVTESCKGSQSSGWGTGHCWGRGRKQEKSGKGTEKEKPQEVVKNEDNT